ncbi:MAG: cytochrome C [Acidobacteria bacterium]|nr:cytochrome C [Acidobacteriota bacterium]
MFRKYRNFLRGISVNRIGQVGVILTTTAFAGFLFFEFLRLIGVLDNAYIGLITYMLFPAMFIVGLALMPLAWYRYRKKQGKSTKELLNERFDPGDVREGFFGSRVFLVILVLTMVNVLFITGAGFRTLKFMDEPKFCGTACHSVMGPEWTAYQQSPHSRVKCVECHVGQGVDAVVSAKLNGLRQMALAMLSDYERPIPTPVHQLRPSRETCEQCHWPDKFYGSRMVTRTHYGMDRNSTPRYTTLQLKIDTGHDAGKGGIHWHVASDNQVQYASVGDKREDIIWVDWRQPDGSYRRFENIRLKNEASEADHSRIRTMDCVDCHNRVTHVYEDAEAAVDDRIMRGLVDRFLPFVKREMLAAISANYPSDEAGLEGIRKHLMGFYRALDAVQGARMADRIDQAVVVAQDIYRRNIHHHMRIDWNTYSNHLGHQQDGGCFRCHNPNMRDKQGKAIRHDCTLCHSILAYDEENRFQYLFEPDKKNPNYKMHLFLRNEFLNSEQGALKTRP